MVHFLAEAAPQGGSSLMMFLPYILIFAVIWFLMIRPQAKKQKEHQKMVAALQKGDKVVTAGGLHATVADVREDGQSVWIKIADSVKVEIERNSVQAVVRSKTTE